MNSEKSAMVVCKILPLGGPKDTRIYPRVNLKEFSKGKPEAAFEARPDGLGSL